MPETINHPSHYQQASEIGCPVLEILLPAHLLKLECIEVIEQIGAGFHYGNALKYLWRVGNKGEIAGDLKKARWYLQRILATHDNGEDEEAAKIVKAVQEIDKLLAG